MVVTAYYRVFRNGEDIELATCDPASTNPRTREIGSGPVMLTVLGDSVLSFGGDLSMGTAPSTSFPHDPASQKSKAASV